MHALEPKAYKFAVTQIPVPNGVARPHAYCACTRMHPFVIAPTPSGRECIPKRNLRTIF